MVTVDEIGKVRRAYWVQGKKIKAIARETGCRVARCGGSCAAGRRFSPTVYRHG
jgi:hypothetical protein